jgi:hypothetical protein
VISAHTQPLLAIQWAGVSNHITTRGDMYIFAKDGILSIVAHRTKPGMLMVRSVAREDIAKFWPDVKIVELPEADYRYRTTLPRDEVAARIMKVVAEINYDRMKPSVAKGRKPTYLEAWSAMMALQDATQ